MALSISVTSHIMPSYIFFFFFESYVLSAPPCWIFESSFLLSLRFSSGVAGFD